MPFEIGTYLLENVRRPVKDAGRPRPPRNRRGPRRRTPSRLGGPAPHGWYVPCKRATDAAAALVLLALTAPFWVLAACLVKLTSRGPAFYSQTRLGRSGLPFTIYKIRTMVHDCESLTGPRWSMPGDPRVTWLGHFLRRSHVDELPQLVNVLKGDMSLIGPRPERPEFMPQLERAVPGYRGRLGVRPGISGLAQLQLPPDTDLSSVRRKLVRDLYYIQHLSPWLDLRILLCTALYALGVPFRVSGRLCFLPSSRRAEPLPQDAPFGTAAGVRRKAA